MNVRLIHGDCLEIMATIPDGSIDMVLTDPPYGTTACKWDSVIPFAPLWDGLHRICKANAAIAVFGSEPFSSNLRMSNIKKYRYDWVWEKTNATGFLDANRKPLRAHEIISVFSKMRTRYFPQKTVGKPYVLKSGKTGLSTTADKNILAGGYITINNGLRFPRSVIKFANAEKGLHPTQKPVALCEYLISTYSEKGETVLDICMGSGTTGIAAVNLSRSFIGIEKEKEYFKTAMLRLGAE